jgi:anthranilate phosphoribosyltransferase
VLSDLLRKLTKHADLTCDEASAAMDLVMTGQTTPAQLAGFLVGLAMKGERPEEIVGLARTMRAHAVKLSRLYPEAFDTCGTGGDGAGTINVSSAAALVMAACGVKVAKHGNRSASSRCGSADVLEALGLTIPLEADVAATCLAATGFTYLFAPHYHPATRALAPIRAALGVRTVFNILGPLVNPAQPPLHVIGAFNLEVAQLMAEALSGLPMERTFVVHGAAGWDEPTPIGPFTVFDVRPGRIELSVRSSADYGLAGCSAADLCGGDAQRNADALRAVLQGEDRGAHRDCLLLGTALALEVAGEVRGPREGVARAAEAIDGGAARRLLEALPAQSAARHPAGASARRETRP